MTRTIFIWDIHWCFDEFIALLEKVKYNADLDKLYLTWDLINKWPKAFELIDFLVKNPQIKSVIGNNEVNFIRYIKDRDWFRIDMDWWEKFRNLVEKWLFDKKYEKQNPLFEEYLRKFSKEHIEYILNLSLWIESEKWILLHWWLVPWKKLEEHHIDEITRIRQYNGRPWYEYYDWEKNIIYWHWASDWLRIRPKTKWLDTGCVYWKRLTAYIINNDTDWLRIDGDWCSFEIVQVSAFKSYVSV